MTDQELEESTAPRRRGLTVSESKNSRDIRLMRQALRYAERGWGRVAPNPLVGAVVARGDRVVGRGFHAEFGGDHAEVAALRDAGSEAVGATLYVTLEPCAHWGKTPPCTSAILDAGVSRVVFACADPGNRSGGGAGRLREAGLDVSAGPGAEPARRLNAPFFWRQTGAGLRSPFVVLKLALSLDARLSSRQNTRSKITGRRAWQSTHRLRAGFDALLVGRGTVEVDDPLLTARGRLRPRCPPVRIVMDSKLGLSPKSRLVRSAKKVPLWVFVQPGVDADRRNCLEALGVRLLEAPAAPGGGLEWGAVLQVLAGEGIRSLLVEGGGHVASSLLRRRHVHRLHLLYAPVLYGSEGGEAFPGVDPQTRGSWQVVRRRRLGQDTLLVMDRTSLMAELSSA